MRRDWLAQVARPGHVVLDGVPVLDVLDRDPAGRSTCNRRLVRPEHARLAHAHTHHAQVAWDGDTPTVALDGWITH